MPPPGSGPLPKGSVNWSEAASHTARLHYKTRRDLRNLLSVLLKTPKKTLDSKSAEPHDIFERCHAFMWAADQRLKVSVEG